MIPVRDDSQLLRRCLAALAAQIRPADEIVVVDNGSSDDSAAIALEAGAVVRYEPVQGILRASALGFDAASGDILARLDADSIAPPDWLLRIETALAERPTMSAITGGADFYGLRRPLAPIASKLYLGSYFRFAGFALGHPPLFGSNCAIRASAWSRLRATVHRDESAVHDDLDISFQFAPDMDVLLDPELRVQISGRQVASLRSIGRRFAWAFTTIRLNWKDQRPWDRRMARRRARRAGRTS